MVQVDFLPFATGVDANVESQADYAASDAVTNGFQTGVADPAACNKAWRQGAFVGAAVAKLMAEANNANVLDDGNLDGFVAGLRAGLLNTVAQLALTGSAILGTDNFYVDFSKYPDGTLINGITSQSGQVLNTTGDGAGTAVVNGGQATFPGGNCYMFINGWGQRNFRMGMRVTWLIDGGAGQNTVCLAAGRGDFLSNMIHTIQQFQADGSPTLWGVDGEPSPWQPDQWPRYAGTREYFRVENDDIAPVPLNVETEFEMVICGNYMQYIIDNGRIIKTYYQPNGYFQQQMGQWAFWQNQFANATKISRIWASKLTEAEIAAFNPYPRPLLGSDGHGYQVDDEYLFAKRPTLPKNVPTAIFKMTPKIAGDQTASNVTIYLGLAPDGLPGLCTEQSTWYIPVCAQGGVPQIIAQPVRKSVDQNSLSAGQMQVTATTLTAAVVGNDIVLTLTPTISGANAGDANNVLTHVRVEMLGPQLPTTSP